MLFGSHTNSCKRFGAYSLDKYSPAALTCTVIMSAIYTIAVDFCIGIRVAGCTLNKPCHDDRLHLQQHVHVVFDGILLRRIKFLSEHGGVKHVN